MPTFNSKYRGSLVGALIAAAIASPAWSGNATNQILVTTTADGMDAMDQQCSLREALFNANTNTAFSPQPTECPSGSGVVSDEILLASGSTYLLSLAGPDDTSGDLDVLEDPVLPEDTIDLRMGIAGGNTPATIHQTAAGERVIEIDASEVSISDVAIRGGTSDGAGGGIFHSPGTGTLTLSNVELLNNTALSGGGLASFGNVALVDSSVKFNTAGFVGGGIVIAGGELIVSETLVRGNSAGAGGGIYNEGGSVMIEAGSEIHGNSAAADGAGVFNGSKGKIHIWDSTFAENIAQADGGGIGSSSDFSVELTRTQFTGNSAENGGGVSVSTTAPVKVTGGRFSDNTASSQGGGLEVAQLEARGVAFEGNAAKKGGAFFGGLICELSDSHLFANTAENGGGGSCQILHMQRTRVQANSASQRGGGMYVETNFVIEDSTFAFNVAATDGGGLWISPDMVQSTMQRTLLRNNAAQGDGGAVWVGSGNASVQISNTTISGNSTPLGSGSGLFIDVGATVQATNITLADNFPGESLAKYGDLTLQNSIITSPNGIDCVVLLENPEIDSLGNNLSDDDTCVGLDFVTDQTEVDVLLAPLAYTSSDTMTHALLAGSPAIDNGDNAACDAEPVAGVDQRNGARDVGLNCDIGAHEQGAAVSLTLFGDGFE